MKPKNTICLWFDKDAHEAARFYAATFPDSKVTAVHKAPSDYPGGKKGDVLTVEFTVLGIPCLGLNGGPAFKHSEAFSFQIATDNQEETDRYWNAIVGNGGQESQCGWCKDRWGLSWQITPRALTDALAAGGDEAKRAFEAMMPMKKIDIATIEAARRVAGVDWRESPRLTMSIGKFVINVPQQTLDDLQARLTRTRWADEIDDGWTFGTDRTQLRALVDHWVRCLRLAPSGRRDEPVRAFPRGSERCSTFTSSTSAALAIIRFRSS